MLDKRFKSKMLDGCKATKLLLHKDGNISIVFHDTFTEAVERKKSRR